MSTKHNPPRLWWEREDLFYRKGRLFLGSRDLLEFAQSAETPVYLYNSAQIKENLTRLTQSLEKREIRFKILERCNWFLDRCPGIDALDIGGGQGIPVIEGQKPLDIDRWASVIGKHVKKRDLEIILEPGDYLVKDCGVLILQVNTVEKKGGTKFIGVNGGFNIQNLPAYYNTPLTVAPLSKNATASREQVTIAGNINEAIDLFAENISLPPIQEGDYLGFLNVGGYGSAASSNHCMRGTFSEYLMVD